MSVLDVGGKPLYMYRKANAVRYMYHIHVVTENPIHMQGSSLGIEPGSTEKNGRGSNH